MFSLYIYYERKGDHDDDDDEVSSEKLTRFQEK